jgi:hypothetical protein
MFLVPAPVTGLPKTKRKASGTILGKNRIEIPDMEQLS